MRIYLIGCAPTISGNKWFNVIKAPLAEHKVECTLSDLGKEYNTPCNSWPVSERSVVHRYIMPTG